MGTIPTSVPVDGTRTVSFLSAVAAPAAVTAVEATAGQVISCYLTGDGWAPSGDQATVTDDRWCSSQTFELPGRKTKSLTLRYVFNLDTPADDVARIALAEGAKGYLLNRLQVDSDDAYAIGDWYELWPVTMGEPMVLPAEANAVDRIEQKAFVTGEVVKFQQLV
jgi:hypothetical protein